MTRTIRQRAGRLGGAVVLAAMVVGVAAPANADFAAGWSAARSDDLETAHDEWLVLANRSDVDVQYNMAVLHEQGVDGEPDLVMAREWYRRAADRGFAPAAFRLAQ